MNTLNQFLAQFASTDTPLRQFQNHPEQTRLFTAGGAITAAVTWWTNDFHPQALYFSAVMAPQASTSLYDDILATVTERARIAGKTLLSFREQDPTTRFGRWALTKGFKLIRQTTVPELTLGAIPDVASTALSFTQLSAIQKHQLLEVSYRHYQQTHLINPVRPFESDAWAKVAFADMLPHAPIVTFDAGRITAYCLVYADEATTVEWGWMAGLTLSQLLALQQQQLSWLQHRYQTVRGEFDSTDSMADASRKHWPFAASPVIRTYLKALAA